MSFGVPLYEWVLRGHLHPGLGVIYYATDTLVAALDSYFQESARLASRGVTLEVGRIEALGLRVALDKTEALLFHRPRHGPPLGAYTVVNSVHEPSRDQMKYLCRQVALRRALPRACSKAGRLCLCPWATLTPFGWSHRRDKIALLFYRGRNPTFCEDVIWQ